ncbi:Phosphatidylinositol (PI) 3-kinase [Ascosphaera acerosa]|nr:Phosphatidylinositol (PI) 3-kinase [Ascosphaera acerosa]
MDAYTFATSTQVDLPIHVRIGSLEGTQHRPPLSVLLDDPKARHLGSSLNAVSDLFVTVELWANCKRIGVPLQTAYKAFKTTRTWNEWLQLPLTVRDAPLGTQLAITVWDVSPLETEAYNHAVPFGGTSVSLFDDGGVLRKGTQKCKLHRHKAGDGLANTSTPAAPGKTRLPQHRLVKGITAEEQELERLEGLLKKHEMGEIPHVDWLDRLVFRAVEKKKVEAEAAASRRAAHNHAVQDAVRATAIGGVPGESFANHIGPHNVTDSDTDLDADFSDCDTENFFLYVEFPKYDFPIVFEDYTYTPAPVSTLAHAVPGSAGLSVAPEVRFGPGIEGGSALDEGSIIKVHDFEIEQKGNPCEDKHRRLVRSRRTGVIDRDLKPNPKTRDELNKIMSYGPIHELTSEEKDVIWRFRYHLTRDKRALTKFVKSVNWQDVGEARQAVEILSKWTEIDVDDALELLGPTFGNPDVRAYAVDRLRKSNDEDLLLYLLQLVQALKFEPRQTPSRVSGSSSSDSSLATFLISRAASNPILGSYFHWYLMVECDDSGPGTVSAHRKLFARVEYQFMVELEQHHPGVRKTLLRQGEFIAVLTKLAKDTRFSKLNRGVKIEKLKRFLAEPKNDLVHIDPPIPLPLEPSVMITGCIPDEANVFKSSLSPLLINFRTSEGNTYPIIFKVGDDLRQDQLVIQIISLMDRLLQKENLDLKLTPYRILATSSISGAMQFVPSTSLSAASAKYKGSILAYLRAHNPDPHERCGVARQAMDTYIKSCAGYCVITYLLGVGDRHLDNLLLCPDGHFFHADFGYILGRDPKPFAPLMKLCTDMVEGMGGASSPNYMQFKQYCFTAYTTLRKSANLILNLFSLMVDANIPDIRLEPDKAVLKVQERFHLEMTEEEAIRHFDQLISDSVNAIFGVVIDRLHEFVQGWRA